MNALEDELESRLDALPDLYPDFTWLTMHGLRRCGLVEATLEMLRNTPDATTNDVTMFECEYCGIIERYDENGLRKPAEIGRLVITREMREILADLKGKTLKSYECVMKSKGKDSRSDDVLGIVLGQHAVHLFSRVFPFVVGGARVELSALRCERMSLRDDYGLPPSIPVHAHSVGERITGVELVTDRVSFGGGVGALDIDSAVALRTAHGVYTFSRESWDSTGILVSQSDDVLVPDPVVDRNAAWLAAHPELGAAEVTRTTTKLA